MSEGDCEFCGGHYSNIGAHKRFCKKNPTNTKPEEPEHAGELGAAEGERPPLPGDLTPEDVQEPQEPPRDHMFRVPQDVLDRYGYPYMTITQSRLDSMADALHQADIQADIVTMTMFTTPYGPCGIKISKKDIDEGKRSLESFVGHKIFDTGEYYEILDLRANIRKYYFHLHTIPTDSGYARWEDIQRNSLMMSPEGSPIAPPPVIYSSHYKNKKYHPSIEKAAQEIEKE